MDYVSFAYGALAAAGGLTVLGPVAAGIGYWKARKNLEAGNNIGRIYLRGIIMGDSPSSSLPFSTGPQKITLSELEKQVSAAKNANCKGLILDIDSGGGMVVPSKKIAEYVYNLEVPTVALVNNVAASGAYWIASACDHIVADHFSMVGSISVIAHQFKLNQLTDRLGVKQEVIKTGKYKDMGSQFRETTKEERQIFQEMLDSVHEGFVRSIAEYRGSDRISLEKLRGLANGRVYNGEDAIGLGLVDKLGGLEEAAQLIETEGNFKRTNIFDFCEQKKQPFLLKLLSFGSHSQYAAGREFAQGVLDELVQNEQVTIR